MNLTPVFAGRTESGDLYILYKEEKDAELLQYVPLNWQTKNYQEFETFHLRLPDGEIWALAPGSVIITREDPTQDFWHMKIESGVWTGELIGSKCDLMVAKILDRNR